MSENADQQLPKSVVTKEPSWSNLSSAEIKRWIKTTKIKPSFVVVVVESLVLPIEFWWWFSPNFFVFVTLIAIGNIFSIFMHELAHAFVGTYAGNVVKNIELDRRGGHCHFKYLLRKDRLKLNCLMFLSGPLMTLMLSFVFGFLFFLALNNTLKATFVSLALWNFFLFVINATPVFSRDGSKILRLLVYQRNQDLVKTIRVASGMSYLTSIFVTIFLVVVYLNIVSMQFPVLITRVNGTISDIGMVGYFEGFILVIGLIIVNAIGIVEITAKKSREEIQNILNPNNNQPKQVLQEKLKNTKEPEIKMSFDKYTLEAREIIMKAGVEAKKSNYPYVGTEHFLLSLMAMKDSPFNDILHNKGLSIYQVRQAVQLLTAYNNKKLDDSYTASLTPSAKKMIEKSVMEAANLKSLNITPQHFLLGLLYHQNNNALGVVHALGLNNELEKIRQIAIFQITNSRHKKL